MPIDPQVRKFLDQLEALGKPPFEELTPEEARQVSVADAAALGPPEPVAGAEDRTVPGPAGLIPIRIYTPDVDAPLPTFVYFHGGGWVIGDVATHENLACSIANGAGCVVVSVEYRLAPEHRYPAAVDDAYAATAWVMEHAESIGGDRARVSVGGDSAGGNLAAVVALMARDRSSFHPNLQVLVYPITDCDLDTPSYLSNAEGYLLNRDTMKWFWDHYLPDEQARVEPYVSPLRASDLVGLPPALVITAEYDPLRDEGEAYADRLRQAGVPVTLTRYDGMIHAFIRCTNQFDKARAAVAEVADAIRNAPAV